MILFSVICNQNKEKSWKAKAHADGTMYDEYFIVELQRTKEIYHYHIDNWHYFKVKDIERMGWSRT
jgi:hypothetical protein